MPQVDFTHLHVHTMYSLLDGACKHKDLIAEARKHGMNALAITDHGNMFGVADFYTACRDADIKPIIGLEAYVTPQKHTEKTPGPDGKPYPNYHLVLLAENNTGYRNLLKIASTAYVDGFYYRPRIDDAFLRQHTEGLIALSGCLGGEVAQMLLAGHVDKAVEVAQRYREMFGPENFFIEMQDTGEPEQKKILPDLDRVARQVGLGTVATNDIHYVRKEDAEAQDVLVCINTGRLLSDETRMKFKPHYWVKPPEAMAALFKDYPDSIANTRIIADRCNVELDLYSRHVPIYTPETGETSVDMLRRLCEEGVAWRYGAMTDALQARLDRELEVICGKGFADYFLIVWDFVNYARNKGIPCGARGSGVGTLVGYVLGISTVDPIKFDLLFERFMDPERNEMPDIDIDICQFGRGETIEYVRQKYGYANVAQIITFGTLAAKGVVRDVGRVLDVPLSEVNALCKKITDDSLEKALEAEPELKQRYENEPHIRRLIDIGKRLEGVTRNVSVHAAGVVIADAPLTDYVPLATSEETVVTQWTGKVLDKGILLKMDFLGLRTLTTLKRAVELVKQNHGVDLVLEELDTDDPEVFRLFAEGRSVGIFQFESDGMRKMLMKMVPTDINDLIAANALYRPGAMDQIEDYIKRKHGEDWSMPHEVLADVLGETYGIMVYQEQVMRIANRLGDIPLRRAYSLIKAISKKKLDVIQAEKQVFVKGAVAKGIDKKAAEELFALIEKFGGYGFNKSHSAGYAHVAYQAGYLKAHYPQEYMAAVLTFESGSTDKVAQYIKECREMSIEVLPPDVNESDIDFTVVGQRIRFGLSAVKGLGTKAIEAILEARRTEGHFTSLEHLVTAVDLSAINRKAMECLNDCGAFDSLDIKRSQVAAVLEDAMRYGTQKQADKRKGQMGLFDTGGDDDAGDGLQLPKVPEWSDRERLLREKASLGFYVSSHPLNAVELMADKASTCDIAGLKERPVGSNEYLTVLLTDVRITRTKRDERAMAILKVEDLTGEMDAVVFPDNYDTFGGKLEADRVMVIHAETSQRDEELSLHVHDVMTPEEAWTRSIGALHVKTTLDKAVGDDGAQIRDLVDEYPGSVPVELHLETDSGFIVQLRCRAGDGVEPCEQLMRKLVKLVGRDHLAFSVKPPCKPERKRWSKRAGA